MRLAALAITCLIMTADDERGGIDALEVEALIRRHFG